MKLIFATILLAVAIALFDCNPSLYLYSLIVPITSKLNSQDASPAPHNDFYADKNVWIVGASSGIGRELSIQLSNAGANVVISARRVPDLEETKSLSSSTTPPTILPLDTLSDTETLTAAVASAVATLSSIEILILNAGRSQRQPALETPMQVTRDLLDLNFHSTVELALLTMAADDWVAKESGHIVVTSSVAGKLPVALSTSYSASKAALHGYFNGLRSEHNFLRVDMVCPGPVATPIASVAHGVVDGQITEGGENKMPVDRFTHLMLSGMSGPSWLFYETWISPNPALLFTGLAQYFPGVVANLSKVMGPARIKAFKGGQDIYKMSSWWKEIFK